MNDSINNFKDSPKDNSKDIPVDETKCPICGKNNDCSTIIQNNNNQQSCWCENTEYHFPVDLFTRIPAKFKGKACICTSCAQQYRKD